MGSKQHNIHLDMANADLTNAKRTMEGATTLLIAMLTCWFVDWLQKGRKALQDMDVHKEQMALLRVLESNISKLALTPPQAPSSGLSGAGDAARIGKYAKVRLDLDGMTERCAKLDETHRKFKEKMQQKLDDVNKVNSALEQDLADTQRKLNACEQEVIEAKESRTQPTQPTGNDITIRLDTLQSQYNKAVRDLAVAEAKLTDMEPTTGSRNETETKLKTLQSQHDKTTDDLRRSEARIKEVLDERKEREEAVNKVMNQTKTYVDEKVEECKRLRERCKTQSMEILTLEGNVVKATEERLQNGYRIKTTEDAKTIKMLQKNLQEIVEDNSEYTVKLQETEQKCNELEAELASLRAARSAPNKEKLRVTQGEHRASSPGDPGREEILGDSRQAAQPDHRPDPSRSSLIPLPQPNMDLYENPTPFMPARPSSPRPSSPRPSTPRSSGPRPFNLRRSVSEDSNQMAGTTVGQFSAGLQSPRFSSSFSINVSTGLSPRSSPGGSPGSPSDTNKKFQCGCGGVFLHTERAEHGRGCSITCKDCQATISGILMRRHRFAECLSRQCPYCKEWLTLENFTKKIHVGAACKYTPEQQWTMDEELRDEQRRLRANAGDKSY